MSKYIYCGYPNIGAAQVVLSTSSSGIIQKPSGGYLSLQSAFSNYPEDYCLLQIELTDNAELDEYYANSCTDEWKIYKTSDVVSLSIYDRS